MSQWQKLRYSPPYVDRIWVYGELSIVYTEPNSIYLSYLLKVDYNPMMGLGSGQFLFYFPISPYNPYLTPHTVVSL